MSSMATSIASMRIPIELIRSHIFFASTFILKLSKNLFADLAAGSSIPRSNRADRTYVLFRGKSSAMLIVSCSIGTMSSVRAGSSVW